MNLTLLTIARWPFFGAINLNYLYKNVALSTVYDLTNLLNRILILPFG